MITRFSVIPDERNILLGIDKAGVFEAGVVYEVTKILGEIVIRPVGKYALNEKGFPSKNSAIEDIIYYGEHLITKEEKEKIK
jgi:hypothetical protein